MRLDNNSIPFRHPPPAVTPVAPAVEAVAPVPVAETIVQAREAAVPSTVEPATVKSIPVKPATAMETSAPAMRRSVGEIWLAERGNAQQSGSQSPSYPGPGFMFAQPLNRRSFYTSRVSDVCDSRTGLFKPDGRLPWPMQPLSSRPIACSSRSRPDGFSCNKSRCAPIRPVA
jgi:hypothetical protein